MSSFYARELQDEPGTKAAVKRLRKVSFRAGTVSRPLTGKHPASSAVCLHPAAACRSPGAAESGCRERACEAALLELGRGRRLKANGLQGTTLCARRSTKLTNNRLRWAMLP